MTGIACELCARAGGEILWQDRWCRVILVADPDYPGFCRVVWNTHVKEMSDLNTARRTHLMSVVFAMEDALRHCLSPDKINLASLGNAVPHLTLACHSPLSRRPLLSQPDLGRDPERGNTP